MREISWLVLLVAAAAWSAGCSTRGVYEGLQQREAINNPSPGGQAPVRRQTYDEYENERRKAAAPY